MLIKSVRAEGLLGRRAIVLDDIIGIKQNMFQIPDETE